MNSAESTAARGYSTRATNSVRAQNPPCFTQMAPALGEAVQLQDHSVLGAVPRRNEQVPIEFRSIA